MPLPVTCTILPATKASFVGLLPVDDDGRVINFRRNVGSLRLLVDEKHLIAVGVGNHSGADDVALGRLACSVSRAISHGIGFARRVVGAARCSRAT